MALIEGESQHAVESQEVEIADSELSKPLHSTILLAEDGPDNQRLISFLLRKQGAEVVVVENGQRAIEAVSASLASDKPFDVVLMDMQMPILDGYSAARKLRAQGCAIPVISLTAHAMAEDRKRCLEAGCDDYAVKPVNRNELIRMIRHWTSRKKSLPMKEGPNMIEPLKSEFADDPELSDLVEMFIEGLPSRIENLNVAMQTGDGESLRRLAHQLKGAAGGYGFPSITEKARMLEAALNAEGGSAIVETRMRELTELCERAIVSTA